MSNQVPQIRFNGYHDAWEKRKLSNVVSLLGGNAFKSKDSVTEEGVRWLKIANVSNSGIKWNEESFLPSDYWERYPNYRIVAGDYVMALTRPIIAHELKIAKMPLGSNALLNQRVAKLIWNMNADFGFQLLRKRNVVDYIEQTISGTDPPNLSGNTFEKIMVSVPETVEQEKIGRFLETVDNLLAVNQRKLDLLKEQKKGYLQKMFPKNGAKVPELRFAGFANDWEERKLSSGLREYTDRVIVEDDKEYYQISVRNNFGGITLRGSKMGNKIGRKRQAKINLTKYPQTLIFTRQTVEQGGIGWVDQYCDGAIVTENMPTISLDTSVFSKYFLTNLFQTRIFYKNAILDNVEGGSAQIAIHESKFLSSTLLFPNLDEQEKIGQFFKQLDNTIALHQRKLELLKEQKNGFLQKMFV